MDNIPFIVFIKDNNVGKRDSLVLIRSLLYNYSNNITNNDWSNEFRSFTENYIKNAEIEIFDYLVGTDADTVFDNECTFNLLKEIKSIKDAKDWSIFHNLYFISVGNENLSKDILEKSKKNRSNNEIVENKNTTNPLGSLSNLTNIMSDPMMMSMVSSILPIGDNLYTSSPNLFFIL